MDAKRRQMFEAYLQQQIERANAFSVGDKLALLERLRGDAVEQGVVPIAPGQVARVPVQSPRVQAILAGKEVALGGTALQGQTTLVDRLNALPMLAKLVLLLVVFLVPMGALWGMGQYQDAAAWADAALTGSPEAPATLTLTPTPTPLPGSVPPTSTPYAQVLDNAGVPTAPHDPVSISFANIAFTLKVAKLDDGAWQPAVAEWLPGTDLRRVVALPYTQEVGNAVATLTFGSEITVRLLSGEVVLYRLVDIQRAQRYEIEVMNALVPSLVVILHGERAGQRWVLVADAVQGVGLPELPAPPTQEPTTTLQPTDTPNLALTPSETPVPEGSPTTTPTATWTPPASPTWTPTLTLTPTPTSTPALVFVPPVPVTEIFTEAFTVTNEVAGLQLLITNCSRVAQIGANQGHFVVCDVTLTALRDQVTYSADAFALAELSQVQQVPGWWPPALSVVGNLGNGQLAYAGDTVTGKVAGKVAKKQGSTPVLLWEQMGVRFVITLDELLDE